MPTAAHGRAIGSPTMPTLDVQGRPVDRHRGQSDRPFHLAAGPHAGGAADGQRKYLMKPRCLPAARRERAGKSSFVSIWFSLVDSSSPPFSMSRQQLEVIAPCCVAFAGNRPDQKTERSKDGD